MKSILAINIVPVMMLLFVFYSGKSIERTNEEIVPTLQTTPWVAPPEADKIKNPFEISEYTLEDGKEVYTTNCASCHGENGDGNTPIAAALNPKPKNYADGEFLKQSDGAIYWKITNGRGLMVSFKGTLSEEELWSTIVYIKDLAKK